MRFISTRVHGMLDYPMSLIVLASPWLFLFADGGIETWIPVALGAMMLLMAICTRYEFGVVKRIDMKAHLTVDALGGIFLAASPWIFDFADRVWVPFVVLGLLELGAALTTDTNPSTERRHLGRPVVG